MKRKQNYNSMDSLKQVKKVIDEAGESIRDKSKITVPDDIKEIIGATIGAGIGVGAGVAIVGGAAAAGTSGAAALTSGLAAAGGVVGGGMMAGIFVTAAPVAVLGVTGYAIVSKINKDKIQKQKELLLKESVAKHNKIIVMLSHKADQSKERIDHLTYLNTALRRIIDDLGADLQTAA